MIRTTNQIVPGEHFLKGVLGSSGGGGLATAVFFYILRSMGVSGADFTALVGAASSPWALKPILGFVNEALPIYGYKSRFCELYLLSGGVANQT